MAESKRGATAAKVLDDEKQTKRERMLLIGMIVAGVLIVAGMILLAGFLSGS